MLEQFVTWRGKRTRQAYWQRAWRTKPLMRRLSGLILSPSTAQRGAEQWIASLAGSRASPTAPPESAKGSMTSAGCGTTSRELFGTLSRGSFIWKTCQVSLIPEDLPLASQAFPKWGSLRNGDVFQRPAWVPATSGNGFSYWPSSRAEDGESCSNHPGATDSLTGAVSSWTHWDTPDTMPEMPNTGSNRKAQPAGLGNQAQIVMVSNWPSPTVTSCAQTAEAPSPLQTGGTTLAGAAERLWQTPKAGEEDSGSGCNSRGEPKLKAQAMLWTTPQAHDVTGRGSGQVPTAAAGNACLVRDATMWRTPDAMVCGGAQDEAKRTAGGHALRLQDQTHSWPTPMTINRTSDKAQNHRPSSGPQRGGPSYGLEDIANSWPTPAARDHKGANSEEHATLTGGAQAYGSVSQFCGIFAPGPGDPRWAGIIADEPWRAPATQPGVRMLVDGVACVVDESRNDQLRAIGNGVVATAAAAAFTVLARRAGVMA